MRSLSICAHKHFLYSHDERTKCPLKSPKVLANTRLQRPGLEYVQTKHFTPQAPRLKMPGLEYMTTQHFKPQAPRLKMPGLEYVKLNTSHPTGGHCT